ncbi:MAG: hypothetical protein P4N59_25990 [Negativicutes bacterium]|nr:hypothetical protein [Negativicutes bacterium]
MRVGLLVILFLLWGSVQAVAMTPINADVIAQAQEYGKTRTDRSLTEFFQPWTVYEEKADKLDETGERAFVYTPFLLIAADARDKTLNSQTVRLSDAEQVLTEYNGYLIFGVIVFGNEADFAAKMVASLMQGGKSVRPQSMYQPPEVEKAAWSSSQTPVSSARWLLYFKMKDLAVDKPLVLQINQNGKPDRRFFFDLAGIR